MDRKDNAIFFTKTEAYTIKCSFSIWSTRFFCVFQNLPFIISNVNGNNWHQVINNGDCEFNINIHLIYLDTNYTADILKKCVMTFNLDSISYISTSSLPSIKNYNPNDGLVSINCMDDNIWYIFYSVVEDDQFDCFTLCADDTDVLYERIDVDNFL